MNIKKRITKNKLTYENENQKTNNEKKKLSSENEYQKTKKQTNFWENEYRKTKNKSASLWYTVEQNTRLQIYHCWLSRVLDIQNPTFLHWFWMEKSVDFSVSEFFSHCDLSVRLFHQRVRGLASHQCKFHFDSMYGGLDTPYSSNNMKIAKEGSLDARITWKRQMVIWKRSVFIFHQLGW